MSKVLANPKSSDPPPPKKNNNNDDPPKVETSKLISPSANKTDLRDIFILNKCHAGPRFINSDYFTFLFITLKVQDIHVDVHNLLSKSIPFTFFCDFIF